MLVVITTILLLVHAASGDLKWKLLNEAEFPSALCNDFTRAGYFVRRNNESKSWVIVLESGGLCYSSGTCNRRYFLSTIRREYSSTGSADSFETYGNFDPKEAWDDKLGRLTPERRVQEGPYVVNPLMTSMQCVQNRTRYFPNGFEVEGRDILDSSSQANPLFWQYNHVVIPYCSSDNWLGEETQDTRNYSSLQSQTGGCDCFNYSCFDYDPSYQGLQFTFRGKTIFQSVIQDLLNGPLQEAEEVFLFGSSAGGVGVINNAKWARDTLQNVGVRLRVIFESAWFVNFHGAINEEFGSSVLSQESSNDGPTSYSFLDVLGGNDACTDLDLGYPCCAAAHCLLPNKEYYPQDVPTFAITSLYDAYLLSPALASLEPVSSGRNTIGYTLDFVLTVGAYGGAMNTTLEKARSSAGNLTLYVTECLQHVYLATSSLWGDDGASVFGDSSVELANDLVSFRLTLRSGVWNSRYLAAYNGTIEVTISDALRLWYRNGLEAITFRDNCRGAHCNSECPEAFDLGDLTSNNWPTWSKVLIVSVIVAVGVFAVAMKLLFIIWLWWVERKQVLYLESLDKSCTRENHKFQSYDVSTSQVQFPDCLEEDAMSVACLDLRYTIQFKSGKAKDERTDNTSPLFLPIAPEEELDDTEEDDVMAAGTPSSAPKLTRRTTKLFPEDAFRSLAYKLNPKTPTSQNEEDNESPYIPPAPPPPPIIPPQPFPSDGSEATGPFGRRKKTILKGISIYFNPGELVGIMGPSGCGKTTFLDLLTGRRKKGTIEGEIYINGDPMEEVRDWYVANTGYVLQLATPYYEELTVRENLTLAAHMRLPKSFSLREKFERVEQVMEVTDLSSLGDTVVGGATGPGLSGGQKRRLSVAFQLLKLPSIIFLDEPTSGLDAASSIELLNHLNKLADSNRVVVLTIHQPRLEIFHMFDRLMLLSDGKVAYHGVPDRAYEVFVCALSTSYLQHGLIIPDLENHNPADVIMDMLGNQKTRQLITEYYQSSSEPDLVKRAIKSSRGKARAQSMDSMDSSRFQFALHGGKKVGERHASTFYRLATLEARGAKRSRWVNTLYLPVIFFAYGFLLGTVYFQQAQPLLVISGFCVYSVASALFMFPFLYLYYQRALEVYGYERADGIGRSGDIVIQGFIRGIFAAFLPVIICAGVLYLLLVNAKSYDLLIFLQVVVVNIALNQTWTALLICLICAFPDKAFRLSPIISSVAGFTSGFFIPIGDIPWWYRWMCYINPNYYGFSSSAFLLLDNFETDCDGTEFECYPSSGEYVLGQFDFDNINPYLHILILLLFTAFYLLLATLANWYRDTTIQSQFKRLNIVIFRNPYGIDEAVQTPRGRQDFKAQDLSQKASVPSPYSRNISADSEPEEKVTSGDKEAETECSLTENNLSWLEDSQGPLTPHSRVRLKWKVAAKRSLDEIFETDEEDETKSEFELSASPERPSELRLNQTEGTRRRKRPVKSVFLHEGDIHQVWKGKTPERRPQLADIALVALQKKREKDLQERQRYLYSRVAATQAALKDQTEELLGQEDEEETEEEIAEEKVEPKVDQRKRMTFKQASAKVLQESKRKRKSVKHVTTLTDIVNHHMKAQDPMATSSSAAQRQSYPARPASGLFRQPSIPHARAMSIGKYRQLIRQQHPMQSLAVAGMGGFAESAYPFQSLPVQPARDMRRNISDTEIATSKEELGKTPKEPGRSPKIDALKQIAARRKQQRYYSQLPSDSDEADSKSPVSVFSPEPDSCEDNLPQQSNGQPLRLHVERTGLMAIDEAGPDSHVLTSSPSDDQRPPDSTSSEQTGPLSPLLSCSPEDKRFYGVQSQTSFFSSAGESETSHGNASPDSAGLAEGSASATPPTDKPA